jgi:hypothetical protein
MRNEIEEIKKLIQKNGYLQEQIRYESLATIAFKNQNFSVDSFSIGAQKPEAPVVFLIGGVHGIERIGADLCMSLLQSTIQKLVWDQAFRNLTEKIRLVFIPLLNPAGYYFFMRCNANGVDLMRNAPVDAEEKVPFLLGGHRYSKLLPWYRGHDTQVEIENQVLFQKFLSECGKSQCVVSVDFHSGFGFKDRLWFPFSKTKVPFAHLPEMHSFSDLFLQTYPYHIYKIEPQSHGYLLHGDVWDYLYQQFKQNNSSVYLPLTLEMGSWTWVKKNPLQIITKHGLFNPIKDHRIKRTYRRHHILFDFILRALFSYGVWAELSEKLRHKHFERALTLWYPEGNYAKLNNAE